MTHILWKLLTTPLLGKADGYANHVIFNCICHPSTPPYLTNYDDAFLGSFSVQDERRLALLILQWATESLGSGSKKKALYSEIRRLAEVFKDPLAKCIVMYPIFQSKPLTLNTEDSDFTILLGALCMKNPALPVDLEFISILPPMLKCRHAYFAPHSEFTVKDKFENRFAINILKLVWETSPDTALEWMANQWGDMNWERCPKNLREMLQKEWVPLLLTNMDKLTERACLTLARVMPTIDALGTDSVKLITQEACRYFEKNKDLIPALDQLVLCTTVIEANQYLLELKEKVEPEWSKILPLRPTPSAATILADHPDFLRFMTLVCDMNSEIIPPQLQLLSLKPIFHKNPTPPSTFSLIDPILEQLFARHLTDTLLEAHTRGREFFTLMTSYLKEASYLPIKTYIIGKVLEHLSLPGQSPTESAVKKVQCFWLISSIQLPSGARIRISGELQPAHSYVLGLLETLNHHRQMLGEVTLLNIGQEAIRLCNCSQQAVSSVTFAFQQYAQPVSLDSLHLALDFILKMDIHLAPPEDIKIILLTFLEHNFTPTLQTTSLDRKKMDECLQKLLRLLSVVLPRFNSENLMTPFRKTVLEKISDMLLAWIPTELINDNNEKTVSDILRQTYDIDHTGLHDLSEALSPKDVAVLLDKCVAIVPLIMASEHSFKLLKGQLISTLLVVATFALDSRKDCLDQKAEILSHFFEKINLFIGKSAVTQFRFDIQDQLRFLKELCVFSQSIYQVPEHAGLVGIFEASMRGVIQSIASVNKKMFAEHIIILQENSTIPIECKRLFPQKK